MPGPTHPYLGASAGCWAAWGELQARLEIAWQRGRWSPLAIDAYAAQHPGDPGRRQAQSVTVHLVSLCLVLEHGWDAADTTHAKRALVQDDPVFPWLEPPRSSGDITIADVLVARPGRADEVVERWARSVWDAWSAHREVIERHAAEVTASVRSRPARR